jgi:transposase
VNDAGRIASIVKWVKRIEATDLSVSEFFETKDVPFSRAQYYKYRRQLRESGPAGLNDRRVAGGNRKITFEHEAFLKGCIKQDPSVGLESLRQALTDEFGCELSASAMSRALARIAPQRRRDVGRPMRIFGAPRKSSNALGGFELIVALAWHLGWPQKTAKVISKAVDAIKKTDDFLQGREASTAGRNKAGRFTKRYNQRRDVRVGRFASVSDKRQKKNWHSMNIVKDHPETLARKSLSILSLPIVSNNGQVRSVNAAQGQNIGHFCGFNYKQSSIAKYLTELKYIGASNLLLQDLVEFWKLCWQDTVSDSMMGPLLCYYIDGNTKALWSSKRVKKNKVTMLGRVMGCIEQVFIHDGLGHPIYFENYSGHGPTGERILGLFEKIEDAIEDVPRSKARVFRAIVMDGANNSVKTLRAFAAQDTFHYITTLDDNQWKDRRVRSRSHTMRYRYGSATLKDHEIELEDSQEKGHLISTRAIAVEWDNGRRTVLLTSLPRTTVDASEIVFSYFRRWPAQELTYRYEKATVCLSRVAGYGRKAVANARQREKQERLARKIDALTEHLKDAIAERTVHEQAIARLIPKERRLRARTRLVNGRRVVPRSIKQDFEQCGKDIRRHEKAIRAIERAHEDEFKKLTRSRREWLRLQGKDTDYAVDVELDQILTYFRASLVHLYAYFIHNFLGGEPLSLVGLVHRVLHLPAEIEETNETRTVVLQSNPQDPNMMRKLHNAMEKLNGLKIQGTHGKMMQFRFGGLR